MMDEAQVNDGYPFIDGRVTLCRLERRLYRNWYLSGSQHGDRDGDV